MKKKLVVFSIILITVVALLTGCTQSEEEVFEDTKTIANTIFNNDDVDQNKDLENFSLYLPNDFEIVEESQSNLVMEEDDQTYILFYNSLEDTTSELNYQEADATNSYAMLESFEDENRFGYVGIRLTDDESYELQVGVGGVKITTITSIGSLEENTEEMMKMANSIAYTSHE